MSLDTLVATTNTILRLDRPTPADLMNACMVGCKELQLLAEDDAFFGQVHRASTRSAERSDISRVFDDLAEFEKFLEVEARTLRDAGVDPRATRDLLNQARNLHQRTRNWRHEADDIRAGIVQLRDSTCSMVEQLSQLKEAVERRGEIWALLRRVATGLGGATIVVVDASAEVTLGALYANASVDLGVALVAAALAAH